MDTREESPPGSRLDRILPLRDQAPELVNARTSDASAEEGGEKWLKATAVDYIKEDTRTEDEQQPGVFNIQPHHLHMQPSDDGEDSGESSLSGGGDVNKDSGDGGNDGFETVERESRQQAGRMEEDDSDDYGDMRIAVLVPYSGPGLPVWFDAFMDLAAANGKLMDWIIFCDQVRWMACVLCISTPKNCENKRYILLARSSNEGIREMRWDVRSAARFVGLVLCEVWNIH